MKQPLRAELWRIAKFILISAAINVVFALLYQPFQAAVLTSGQPGKWLSLLSHGRLWLSAIIACLIHRYFTFCATERWFIALPLMLLFALGWQLVSSVCMHVLIQISTEAVIAGSHGLMLPELVLSYLFQRYVLYCHTTDTNGWYRRMHPADTEEVPA